MFGFAAEEVDRSPTSPCLMPAGTIPANHDRIMSRDHLQRRNGQPQGSYGVGPRCAHATGDGRCSRSTLFRGARAQTPDGRQFVGILPTSRRARDAAAAPQLAAVGADPASRASRRSTRLGSALAHELNQPLTAIIALSPGGGVASSPAPKEQATRHEADARPTRFLGEGAARGAARGSIIQRRSAPWSEKARARAQGTSTSTRIRSDDAVDLTGSSGRIATFVVVARTTRAGTAHRCRFDPVQESSRSLSTWLRNAYEAIKGARAVG